MEQDILVEVPLQKVHKRNTISIAAFLTGPLTGGYLIAENFRSLGKAMAAKITLVATVIVTVLLLLLSILPAASKIPSMFYAILISLLSSLFSRKYQRKPISEHIALGGKFYTPWRAVVASLICILLTMGIFWGIVWLREFAA